MTKKASKKAGIMDKKTFHEIENFMLERMKDSAHDKNHIYRVLYSALDIAETESPVDMDVLLAACLLHDIGREKQSENLELCHAQIGGDMAYDYLIQNHWPREKAEQVKLCIVSHRYRKNSTPESIEAKILFDADKLDATGALGIARTLVYEGQISEPMYILDNCGEIDVTASDSEISSFFQEYNYKLKNLYDRFYTKRARQIALEHKQAAEDFYNRLLLKSVETTKRAG